MHQADRFELAPGYWISRVINGCWQLTPDHGGGPGSEKQVQRNFAEFVDHDFTTFDCADIYVGVEEMLGRFRRSLPDPDKIQIHTKYVPDRHSLHLLTNEDIDTAVDRSLKRLGVERLDLLQYHWWSYDVAGLDKVTERLIRAREAGKIRLLGVTNFDTPHVRQIIEDGAGIVSLQGQYSLIDRRPERHMTDCSAETGVYLLPYGVLAGGFLSDTYLGVPPPPSAAASTVNRSLQKYRLVIDEIGGWGALQRLLDLLSDIADRHQTTIAAVAARWVLDQPGVAAIILGTGHRSRAAQNVALVRLRLDENDRQQITAHLESQMIPPGDMYELERDFDGPHTGIIRMNVNADGGNR